MSDEEAEEELELLLEELQSDYAEKCDEVVDLQRDLRAANIEVQQLQARLHAAVRSGPPLGGGGPVGTVNMPGATLSPGDDGGDWQSQQELRASELSTLIVWLAAHVDLSRKETYEVGFKLSVGGRSVTLQRIAQWPLAPAAGTELRFTVPVQRHREMQVLLAAVRSAGVVPPSALARFATTWELVSGEVATYVEAPSATPALLLVHRDGQQSMLVCSWPTQEKLRAFYEHHPCPMPRVGDRVEAEYEGQWYPGYVHFVDVFGKAGVQCDVDPKGVYTLTPFSRVNRLVEGEAEELPCRDALAEHMPTGGRRGPTFHHDEDGSRSPRRRGADSRSPRARGDDPGQGGKGADAPGPSGEDGSGQPDEH